ncbi:MAG: polysaccharide deacetylase family protein [Candidatus Eisenbacteria bacterium]|nr:polysaccharide deacetylase family protein [Candidatus Eisenbacteria bacterium]
MSGALVRWALSLVAGGGDPKSGPPRLTIVRHHRVYADGERALYHLGVSESMLTGQLAACARAGLTPVSVAEALARLDKGTPGHVVAFSFDDGYADNITRALPILERAGARATFYLTAGLMEERRAPWWDELAHALERATKPQATLAFGGAGVTVDCSGDAGRAAALRSLLPLLRVLPAEQSARLAQLREALGVEGRAPCELADWTLARKLVISGMEVGAHTLTHPFLTLLSPDSQRREMADSGALIREKLGAGTPGVAYPNGDHDAHTVAAARSAGFAYAVITRSGDVNAGSARWELARRPLTEGACTGPFGFSARMTMAEVHGAFDHLRKGRVEVAS